PYRLGDAPRATPPAAPACGAHTDQLLAELGMPATQIEELRRAGVVA
ncbi:MAG: CoA transferase, partial [Comamonadaceae bacterium]